MRDEFFGDDRDLFKWSHVLDLAEPDSQIIYVPMCRPDDRLQRRGGTLVREDVRRFFREDRMKSIIKIMPDRIVVPSWNTYEDSARKSYFGKVHALLAQVNSETRRVVFVDPDTGMEPEGTPSSKHIRVSSLAEIWGWLRKDDVLVIYQHAPQDRRKDWVTAKAQQVSEALGVPPSDVQRRQELDVCFYWSVKKDASARTVGSAI